METLRRTFHEALADNLTGESAKVAYYLFLSLFPLILLIFSLTGLFGGQQAFAWIMGHVEAALPRETAAVLEDAIREITSTKEAGALGIGLLLTFWAASGGFAALADGLNTMYDIEESRSWWKKRAIAAGILLAATVLLIGGSVVILAGPAIGRALGLGGVWDVAQWPLAFALLTALFWLIYYFLPNREQDHVKVETLVGALVGAALWLAATFLFRLYVSRFGSYSETYGFIGAVIVLMLWLYVTALVALFGGELAAVLEARRAGRSSPKELPREEAGRPAAREARAAD